MNWTPRRQRLRQLLSGESCCFPISVFDPMSARMAQGLDFEIGMLAGSVAAMSVLAAPDLVLITASEFVDLSHRISRAAELPLLVDADHGYGNALNVARTVGELDRAGIAAMTIEDTVLPVPFGAGDAARLCSIEEGIGKMKAALDGRVDPDLVILGRTSAPMLTGPEDAIARAKAYGAAGVDGITLIGVRSQADLEAIASEIELPIMLGGAPAELIDADYLAGLGVRICLRGHQSYMAALGATYEAMRQIRDGAAPGKLAGLATGEQVADWTRAAEVKRKAAAIRVVRNLNMFCSGNSQS